MTEPSTITHNWLAQPGPINLRQSVRRDTRERDLRASEGILLAAMIGLNLAVWLIAIWRWL